MFAESANIPPIPTMNKNYRKSATFQKNRLRMFVRDSFKCQYPGCNISKLQKVTCHHVTPVCEGGSHELENLATVCSYHQMVIHSDPAGVEQFRHHWQNRQAAELLEQAAALVDTGRPEGVRL